MAIPYPKRGRNEIDLGPVHPQDCATCGCERPFHLRLVYHYEHLFHVLGNVRGRSYLLVCDECNSVYRIPATAAYRLARLQGDPFPFLHRYGCLLFILLIALLGLIGWILEGKFAL